MFYQKKNNKLEPLTGSTLYAETPIGTVIASFLAVAPSGYIKADGTVYTKAAYPELYERIPDVFKDTTNETFTIDLREVALKGIGLSSLTSDHYSSTGLTLGEFIEDRLQNHRHPDTSIISVSSTGTGSGLAIGSSNGGTGSGGLVGSDYRSGNTTEVKSVGVNYFIKAKHVALPIDIMDAISEEYATKEYVNDVKEVFTSCTVSGNEFSFPYSGKHGLFFIEIGGQGNNTGYAIIAAVKIYDKYSTHIVASAAGGTGSTVSSVSWNGTNITVTMSGQYFYEPKYRQL